MRGKGDRGTALLQHAKLGGKVTLKSKPEDYPELKKRQEDIQAVANVQDGPLPLCHEAIVAATCETLNGGLKDAKTVTAMKIKELLSLNASSTKRLWRALNLTDEGTTVPCSLLCESVVKYVKAYGICPPTSDRACTVVGGEPKCDLDVSPPKLVRALSGAADFRPDSGFRADGPALLSGAGLVRHSFGSSKDGFRASRERVAVDIKEGESVSREQGREWLKRKFCPYSLWESVELVANFFRIYPSSGRRPMIDMPPSLAQGAAAATTEEMIVSNNAEAKAWVSQVVVELANQNTLSFRQEWFGGSGSLSTAQVRQRIILAMDFVERELDEVRYVYPADDASDTACDGNTAAYVWKSNSDAAGYEETTGPSCGANADPFSKHCAVDTSGRFFVYLCKVWANDPESWRIATLVHEAAHHTGPTDWSYDIDTMKGLSQDKQLDNAANYQNFAQEVANAAWGCVDSDPPSLPFSCNPGPCTCPPLAGYCNDATYGSTVTAQCPMTCGACSGGGSSPGPAPTPSPPSSGGGCTEPSTKISITLGGTTYTARCSGFANGGGCPYKKVQNACPVSCGVCSASAASGNCLDDPLYSIQTQVGVLACNDWKQYECWEEVVDNCPLSCRKEGCV